MQNFEINNLSVQFQRPQINKLPLEFMTGQREEQTGFRKWGMQKMPSKNKELSKSWMLDSIFNAGLHCFQCIYMAQEEYMHLWKLQFVKNTYLKSSLAPLVLWALGCIYTKLQLQIQTANQSQALLMCRMQRWKIKSWKKKRTKTKTSCPSVPTIKNNKSPETLINNFSSRNDGRVSDSHLKSVQAGIPPPSFHTQNNTGMLVQMASLAVSERHNRWAEEIVCINVCEEIFHFNADFFTKLEKHQQSSPVATESLQFCLSELITIRTKNIREVYTDWLHGIWADKHININ